VAKAFADEEVEVAPQACPPSIEATEHGMILGTAAYMAPEQARYACRQAGRHLGFRQCCTRW
jgi:hypothetical protein